MSNTNVPPLGYAGDISPSQAWQMLVDNPNTVLVDVRTPEEWAFVGVPNLEGIGRKVCGVPWAIYPNMSLNPAFIEHVKDQAGPDKNTPMVLLCRSGVRSVFAARALTEAGFTSCFNILDGFEGNPDDNGHRGKCSGWKADGLAWQQK